MNLKKLSRLKAIISSYGSCLIAFSGGQDSAFLAKVCSLVLPKKKILAVTAVSPTYPKSELAKAKMLAGKMGIRFKIIKTKELGNPIFASNPKNRCYFCKKELFTELIETAKRNNLKFVLDGSNKDDLKDYRPGSIAKKELNIESPLVKAGFDKNEIVQASRKMGLVTWDKPSLACLASRIPYGTKITSGLLKRIDQAESFLRILGMKNLRLRHHGALCRIETGQKEMSRILKHRSKIAGKLKSLGYSYVSLDLEGYRTGSLNEILKNNHAKR